MSDEHQARLRTIILRRLGFSLEESRQIELAEALERRLAERGRPKVATYLAMLETDDEELRALGELLTVGETCFFRTREHFDVLRDVVLPTRPRSRGDDLRILSAGCSSGEEPYSLAITLREWEDECRLATWLRWHVHAVDLNRRALAKAEAGVYSAWSLRETPSAVLERWFTPRGREHELSPQIRKSVTFHEQNLLDENVSLRGPFDIVFCRNVLMYFAPEAARAVVKRLTEALAPGGFLFLGHADTMRGLSTEYALESSHGTFYYRHAPHVTAAAAPPSVEVRVVVPLPLTPRVVVERTTVSPPTLEEVRELVSLERFDQALERLSLLPASVREEPSTAIVRAVAQLGAGDVEAAASGCVRLLEQGEVNVEAHVLLALVAEHRGDPLEAIEHHRAALYLDPDCALSHLHLGRLERREGRTKEARHELAQALELLEREESSRLLLFAGGFTRAGLLALCRTELATLGGTP